MTDAVGLTLLSIPPFLAAIGSYLQNHAAFRERVSERVEGLGPHGFGRGHRPPPQGPSTSSRLHSVDVVFRRLERGRLQRIADALPAKPSVSVLVFCARENGDGAGSHPGLRARADLSPVAPYGRHPW